MNQSHLFAAFDSGVLANQSKDAFLFNQWAATVAPTVVLTRVRFPALGTCYICLRLFLTNFLRISQDFILAISKKLKL